MARRLPQPPRGQPPPGGGRYGGRPSLGLGLGLGGRQQRGFQQAAQGGTAQQYLAQRPGLQQRVNRLGPTSLQATRLQNFMATGQNQRPGLQQAMPRPPTMGVPGGTMWARRQAAQRPQYLPLQPQLPPQHPLMQAVNPGMQSVINDRLGQGYTGDSASQQANLAAMAGGGWQPMGSPPMYGGGQYGGTAYGGGMDGGIPQRSGMGPGGWGGGQPGGGAGYGGLMTGPGWTGGASGYGQPGGQQAGFGAGQFGGQMASGYGGGMPNTARFQGGQGFI